MSEDMAQTGVGGTDSVPASEGQPSPATQESTGNVANDPAAFQADYTRKYQSLAAERKAFETERQQFYQARQSMPQLSYQPQTHQQQTDYQQELVNQFGQDGARAMLGYLGQTQKQFQAAQFQIAVQNETLQGQVKFGKENWEKHDYVDPNTGQVRNKIMDYRMMMDPMTGRTMTLDQAYKAASNEQVDPKAMEQQIRDKIYAELKQKQDNQPASASTHTPKVSGANRATTPREAALMAMEQHGWQE